MSQALHAPPGAEFTIAAALGTPGAIAFARASRRSQRGQKRTCDIAVVHGLLG